MPGTSLRQLFAFRFYRPCGWWVGLTTSPFQPTKHKEACIYPVHFSFHWFYVSALALRPAAPYVYRARSYCCPVHTQCICAVRMRSARAIPSCAAEAGGGRRLQHKGVTGLATWLGLQHGSGYCSRFQSGPSSLAFSSPSAFPRRWLSA